MSALGFGQIRAMTFDCYGTLIDWEQGILGALAPLLRGRNARPFADGQLLESYAAAEARIEAGPYISYREVLARVTREVAAHFGASLRSGDDSVLAESIGAWPAFPDTVAALSRLSRRFQLIILSNIDPDLFELSRRKLGVAFDHVVTDADVRSYKPAPGHFREALLRTGLPAGSICHVAQSLFHDIAVAGPLGFRTVWVNRRHDKAGAGATPPSEARPDVEVRDLAALADLAVT